MNSQEMNHRILHLMPFLLDLIKWMVKFSSFYDARDAIECIDNIARKKNFEKLDSFY